MSGFAEASISPRLCCTFHAVSQWLTVAMALSDPEPGFCIRSDLLRNAGLRGAVAPRPPNVASDAASRRHS